MALLNRNLNQKRARIAGPVASSSEEAAGNWRNSVTSAAMAALGVPVLPVWLPSALASRMHVVDLRIKSWEVLECTHFCEFNGG